MAASMLSPIQECGSDTTVSIKSTDIHQESVKAYAAFLNICFALYAQDVEVQPRVSAHPTIMMFGRSPRPLYQRPRTGINRLTTSDLDELLRWGYDKYTVAIMEYNKRYKADVLVGLERGEELDPLTRPLIVDAGSVSNDDLHHMAQAVPTLVQRVPGQIIQSRVKLVKRDISYYAHHWARTTCEEYYGKVDWTSCWAVGENPEGEFARLVFALADLVRSLFTLVPQGEEGWKTSEEAQLWAGRTLAHMEGGKGFETELSAILEEDVTKSHEVEEDH